MLNTSFTRLIFALLLFASCAEEQVIREPEDIDLQAKGYIDVSIADENESGEVTDDIKTIRFIIFDGQGPNAKMEVNDYRSFASEEERVAKLNGVFEVSKTDKLLVAIANEPPRLRGLLDQVMYREELEGLQMNMTDVFLKEGGQDGNYQEFDPNVMMMPMSGALWISQGDLKTKEEATNNLTPLKLERAVARVDVYINSTFPHNAVKLRSGDSFIEMYNNYNKSYFIYHNSNNNELGKIQSVSSPSDLAPYMASWILPSSMNSLSVPNKDNNEVDPNDPDKIKNKRLLCTFYLPERFSPSPLKPMFNINLHTTSNHGDKEAAFDLTEMTRREDQYVSAIDTIRRNNLYNVTLTFTDGMGAFETIVEVMKWNEALENRPLGLNNLTLDKASMVLPYTETTAAHDSVFNIITTHSDGWWISNKTQMPNGVTVTGADIEEEAIAANTTGIAEITASKRNQLNDPDRKGYFTVKAGNLRKNVYVTQKGPVLTYVESTLPDTDFISEGGTFNFTANTNLIEGWKLRVYRTIGTGSREQTPYIETDIKLLEEQDRTGKEAKNSTITGVNIPAYNDVPVHTLDFFIYSPEYGEIYFDTKKQGKSFNPIFKFKIGLNKDFPYWNVTRVANIETNYQYNEWSVDGFNQVGLNANFTHEKGTLGNGDPVIRVSSNNRPLNADDSPFRGIELAAGSSTVKDTVKNIFQMYAKLKYTETGHTSTKDLTDVPAPEGITSIGGEIPAAGGRYNLGVFTNLRITQADTTYADRDAETHQWGVRMYVTSDINNTSKGDKLNEVRYQKPTGFPIINQNGTDEATDYTHQDVMVPPNPNTTDRYIAFYLYTYYPLGQKYPQEVYAFTSKQLGTDKYVPSQFLCPPGVLGITADGKELTLRGSREYAGTPVERDSEFGKVHEQTVYAVYYKFNSDIALHRDLQFTSGTYSGGFANDGNGWDANEVAFDPNNGYYPNYTSIPSGNGTWSNNPCPYATINKAKDKATDYKVPNSGGNIRNGGLVDHSWNNNIGLPTATTEIRLANGQTQSVYYRNDKYGFRFTFIDSAGNRARQGSGSNNTNNGKMIQAAWYAGSGRISNSNGVFLVTTSGRTLSNGISRIVMEFRLDTDDRWASLVRCVDSNNSDLP